MGTHAKMVNRSIVLAGPLLLGWIALTLGGGCSTAPPRVYKVASGRGPAGSVPAASAAYVSNADASRQTSAASFASPAGTDPYAASFAAGEGFAPAAEPSRSLTYHLGTGDVLEIRIHQLMDLEKESVLVLPVDRRGQIYLPLLHHVQAAGRTCSQLQNELVLRLSQEYIRDPKVDVSIKKYSSKQVIVLGAVRRPGPVFLTSDCATLMDVISEAGGIQADAAPDIEVLRGAYQNQGSDAGSIVNASWSTTSAASGGVFPRLRVPIERLYGEPHEQVNPLIYPGDVVQVPTGRDGVFYISGEVMQPGVKTFRRPLNIMQAVASAGNLTKIAEDKKCRILRRGPEGQETVIPVDLGKVRDGKEPNILLAQNDTVIVPANPVKKFFDDLDKLIRRGVILGVDMTYDAGTQMGFPNSTGTAP
ncbi:MAG: polysaccharide export protein [Sedimentisphaerales bacterium]|nr:polysaccharide export protein [Sedimentisphaerales bacterium]